MARTERYRYLGFLQLVNLCVLASSVAGLYRRAPPEGKTEELKRQFSAGAEVDLDGVEDATIVAHAFKRWV